MLALRNDQKQNVDFPFHALSFPEQNSKTIQRETSQPYLQLIAGDASDRKFYRLQQAPMSAICMRFPKWEGGYGGDPLSWLGMHHALQTIGIPVPSVLLVDERRSCIWTEDFGDNFLNYKAKNNYLDIDTPTSAETYRYYLQSLDLIVKTQYPAISPPSHPAQKLAFDAEKLMFEMRFFIKHFLNGLMQLDVDETGDIAKWKPLVTDFQRLSEHLGSRERVLCHRDYHVRNVMICAGKAKWIDFQDARMGPHTYDLVSLVRDSYMQITPKTRRALYNYFLTELNLARERQGLAPLQTHDFESEIMHMGLQRNVKAIGSFGYLATQKGKPGYLSYVLQTLDTILAPESLQNSGENLTQTYPAIYNLLNELRHGQLANLLQQKLCAELTQ